MAMKEVSTQETLYGLGCGINFKPRWETTLEDTSLMQLPLFIITLQGNNLIRSYSSPKVVTHWVIISPSRLAFKPFLNLLSVTTSSSTI